MNEDGPVTFTGTVTGPLAITIYQEALTTEAKAVITGDHVKNETVDITWYHTSTKTITGTITLTPDANYEVDVMTAVTATGSNGESLTVTRQNKNQLKVESSANYNGNITINVGNAATMMTKTVTMTAPAGAVSWTTNEAVATSGNGGTPYSSGNIEVPYGDTLYLIIKTGNHLGSYTLTGSAKITENFSQADNFTVVVIGPIDMGGTSVTIAADPS